MKRPGSFSKRKLLRINLLVDWHPAVKKSNGRRSMEGSQRGGGQFRRANIVYFLSRNGSVEHPHLLRVHHLHASGVHLRDVKRWLGEVRGKSLPKSFAWSYKRRYKSGYVWQDLKDDDLITPISDNEYVLKGSLLLQFHSATDGFSTEEIDEAVKAEKKGAEEKAVPDLKSDSAESLRIVHGEEEDDGDTSPPLLDCEPEKSNTDMRLMALCENSNASGKKQGAETFKRSHSGRASQVLRNILKCRTADADEPVLVPAGRCGPTGDTPPRQQQASSEADDSRKSGRRSSSGGKSGASARYRPSAAPYCSQCGMQFDPEKFQAHMRSCRALRGRRKERTSTDQRPLRRDSRSEDDFSRESISGYLT